MDVQLGAGRLSGQLAKLRSQKLLFIDSELLVTKEYDAALRDYGGSLAKHIYALPFMTIT